jgi:hypothetical protein
MKITYALVVKLVDTKDLKAEGLTIMRVSGSLTQSHCPIKSYNFKKPLNLNKKIRLN